MCEKSQKKNANRKIDEQTKMFFFFCLHLVRSNYDYVLCYEKKEMNICVQLKVNALVVDISKEDDHSEYGYTV